MRALLNSADDDIKNVVALTTLLQGKLPPVDTVHAIVETRNGSHGTFCVSFGTEHRSGFDVEVVTTAGRVTVSPTEVTATGKAFDEQKKEGFPFSSGVQSEMIAFVNSVRDGQVNERQSPEEALKDLQVLEALLRSGHAGAAKTLVE